MHEHMLSRRKPDAMPHSMAASAAWDPEAGVSLLSPQVGNAVSSQIAPQPAGYDLSTITVFPSDQPAVGLTTERALPREHQAPATLAATPTATVVQRYQAGDAGHGGIEQRALTSKAVGMNEMEASQVYFGNWLRDLSQLPPKALPLINILALGEFGREITQADLGTYVPSEHLDNPEGGGTVEDPRIQALESSTDPAKRAQFEAALAKLSPDQRKAYDEEQKHRHEITEAAKTSGLPEYIERGKFHAKAKLTDAVGAGATPEGRRLLGDALHAVEDYFSHSNFVEAAIWTLYHNGAPVGALVDRMANTTLGANAALVGGLDGHGQPKIVTGTYAPGANDWVSRFELLKTEIGHGQLTKAFILGWLLRQGIKGEELGRRLGSNAIGAVGGVIGATAGGVEGGVLGAAQGAAEGWRTHSGVGALTHAVTGFFSGGVEGAASGESAGYHEGEGEGETVGGAVGGAVGQAFGVQLGAVEEIVGAASVAALMAAFPEIPAALAALVVAAETDVVAEHETKVSGEQAKEQKIPGPTHSQIAKDAPDNTLFGVSVQLAEAADREVGAAMEKAWQASKAPPDAASAGAAPAVPTPNVAQSVTDLVDKFVSTPSHDTWWQPVLAAAAKG